MENAAVFVISSANQSGIGRIVRRDASGYVVEYCVHPSTTFREVIPGDRLKRIEPPVGSSCFIRDRESGTWNVGALHGFLDGELWVRCGRQPARRIDPEDLRIRSQIPELDPIEYLVLSAQSSPSDAVLRRNFVQGTTKQRRLCLGMTGLVSSRIRLLPHQIRVARRVLADPILRYLLADEVGLGKTVEAGVIIRQYLIDHPGREVLVLTPPALQGQWTDELDQKFDVFSLRGSCRIAPYDEVLGTTIDHRFALVVIDEAHNLVAGAEGSSRSALERFSRVKSLCITSESLLLLTATPLTDHEREYLAMLHLLDPARYPLGDLERFRQTVSLRQPIGHLLLGLNPEADRRGGATIRIPVACDGGRFSEQFPTPRSRPQNSRSPHCIRSANQCSNSSRFVTPPSVETACCWPIRSNRPQRCSIRNG